MFEGMFEVCRLDVLSETDGLTRIYFGRGTPDANGLASRNGMANGNSLPDGNSSTNGNSLPDEDSPAKGASLLDKNSLPNGNGLPDGNSPPDSNSLPDGNSLPYENSSPDTDSLPDNSSMSDEKSTPGGASSPVVVCTCDVFYDPAVIEAVVRSFADLAAALPPIDAAQARLLIARSGNFDHLDGALEAALSRHGVRTHARMRRRLPGGIIEALGIGPAVDEEVVVFVLRPGP
jgi:hypothetical protein